jgi:uncharacterized lipoprotein YmbA
MIGKIGRLLILLFVSGCATTEPLATFYTIGPGGDVHSTLKQSTARSVRLYVSRAIVPTYLSRTNLASFRKNQVEYSTSAFWATSLDQAIPQAVALNLNSYGVSAIGFQALSNPPAHSDEIAIRIAQCEGYDSGDAVLSGLWELRSASGGVISSHSFSIRRTGWQSGHYPSLAALLADEVTELSKQIASRLRR